VGSVRLPAHRFPDRGVGRDNLLDALGRYFSGWTNYQPAATEFIDAGEADSRPSLPDEILRRRPRRRV
jgi:hypothetical protein